jgi:hypothetical protein
VEQLEPRQALAAVSEGALPGAPAASELAPAIVSQSSTPDSTAAADSDFIVTDFGALGNGQSNDAPAFAAAFQAALHSAALPGNPLSEAVIYIPAGTYKLDAANFAQGQQFGVRKLKIVGAGQDQTRIDLAPGDYFLNLDGPDLSLSLSDIHIHQGKGAVLVSSPASSPERTFTFQRDTFTGFTEAAISQVNSDDAGLLDAEGNRFYAAGVDVVNGIGIAWRGLTTGSRIEYNAFHKLRFGLKLGHVNERSWVTYNSFMRMFDHGQTDVWLVPSSDANQANDSAGLIIAFNRFGAEFVREEDNRILIADENTTSGGDFSTRGYSTDPSSGVVQNAIIRDNMVMAPSKNCQPTVVSYAADIRTCEIDNILTGTSGELRFGNRGKIISTVESDTTPSALPDPQAQDAPASDTPAFSQYPSEFLNSMIRPQMFGAVGDGIADDSQAFADAFHAVLSAKYNLPDGAVGDTWSGLEFTQGNTIYLPPGVYKLSQANFGFGEEFAARKLRIIGAGQDQTRIELPDDQYFLSISGQAMALELSDVSIHGGNGAVLLSGSDTCGRLYFVFERDTFTGFSEAAIAQINALDCGRLHVRDCRFAAGDGAQAGGAAIVWAGWNDNSLIEHNTFENVRWGIKFGRSNTRSWIVHNSFLSATTVADIWIVPAPEGTKANYGDGSVIAFNYFCAAQGGDEYRILIADESLGSGDNFLTRDFSEQASSGVIRRHTIRDNVVAAAGADQPLITSFTADVLGFTVANTAGGDAADMVIAEPRPRTAPETHLVPDTATAETPAAMLGASAAIAENPEATHEQPHSDETSADRAHAEPAAEHVTIPADLEPPHKSPPGIGQETAHDSPPIPTESESAPVPATENGVPSTTLNQGTSHSTADQTQTQMPTKPPDPGRALKKGTDARQARDVSQELRLRRGAGSLFQQAARVDPPRGKDADLTANVVTHVVDPVRPRPIATVVWDRALECAWGELAARPFGPAFLGRGRPNAATESPNSMSTNPPTQPILPSATSNDTTSSVATPSPPPVEALLALGLITMPSAPAAGVEVHAANAAESNIHVPPYVAESVEQPFIVRLAHGLGRRLGPAFNGYDLRDDREIASATAIGEPRESVTGPIP